MPFKALQLNATILRALADEGYETPTPIQAKAIPPILEGKDLLGCAQTGTGKTAAFALPIIQRLAEAPADKTHRGPKHPRALILSPTRELAAQIGESFGTYGRHAGLSHTVIFGGVSQFHQSRAIHRGVDILVATPGRLMDLMEQRIVTLKEVRIFVLDEADRMLDMGFIQPIRKIAATLPKPRQTLLFSATMPKEIMHLADSLLSNPVKVAVTPVASLAPLIEQRLYLVPMRQKMALLERLLEEPDVDRVLIFTKTKHGADRVCKNLNHDNVPAVAIHGNKAQNYRTRALDAFRSGKNRVLVATDVAARGLDVDNITHVINFDLPMEPEAYVHRIGRTGRAGATGIAISFCDRAEQGLLRQIEKLTGKKIPQVQLPSDMPTNDHAMAHSSRENGPARYESSRGGRDGGRGGSSYGGGGGGGGGSYGGGRDRSSQAPRSSYGSQSSGSSHAPQPSHSSNSPTSSQSSHGASHTPRPAHAPSHAAAHAPARTPSHAPSHATGHALSGDRRGHSGHAPQTEARPSRPAHAGPQSAPHAAAHPKKQHRKGQNAPGAAQGGQTGGAGGQGGAFNGQGPKHTIFTRNGARKPTHR